MILSNLLKDLPVDLNLTRSWQIARQCALSKIMQRVATLPLPGLLEMKDKCPGLVGVRAFLTEDFIKFLNIYIYIFNIINTFTYTHVIPLYHPAYCLVYHGVSHL